MVQIVWYKLYGTNCMVQIVWYKMYGTNCMVQNVWYKLYGTNCNVQTLHVIKIKINSIIKVHPRTGHEAPEGE